MLLFYLLCYSRAGNRPDNELNESNTLDKLAMGL